MKGESMDKNTLAEASAAAAAGDERSQDEIVAQARVLLADPDAVKWPDSTLHMLFSMALTWCHVPRGGFYGENEANRLLRRIVTDAKGIVTDAKGMFA